MNLFYNLKDAIQQNYKNNAFCIDNTFYTYLDLACCISQIRNEIHLHIPTEEKNIGLVTNDDLETYAAILALWLEGKSYIPINPDVPISRNENVINQASIKTIIDSSLRSMFEKNSIIESRQLSTSKIDLDPKETSNDDLAYIIFTSGTTGEPKGVPISRLSLSNIIEALIFLGINIDHADKCLQMSELTFDVSITSFLYPLLYGACVYTIPKDKIKYSYIYGLIEDQQLTLIQLVPSILNYFKPYFDEIFFPQVKYCTLTAEALPVDLAAEWSECIPNARIFNLYGPTENTVWSTCYEFNRNGNNLSKNGILSIGKFTKGTLGIIVDENNNIVPNGDKGELCLCGVQLTPGYFNKDELTKKSFFSVNGENGLQRFYKTGDLCVMENSADILYLGRIDLQAKIQGFRVELSEIEFHCRCFLNDKNVVAIKLTNQIHNSEIGIVIESENFDILEFIKYLKIKMPSYMIPSKIRFIAKIPLNGNGKIDRAALEKCFY
jgi:D-alanine--poly(phosphoribitol) ligase subunit 1